MPWLELGTLTPGYDWTAFPTPVGESELFRLTQDYTPPLGRAYLIFAARFYPGSLSLFNRAYPSEDDTIIYMPVPDVFDRPGYLFRDIMLKHNLFGRVFASAEWRVTLEAWVDSADDQGNPIQVVDGGIY
ncbi:MAG: hypothetical protein AAF215_31545 [Cyanobacteria bacterium P01_A01_bin.123]